MTSPPPGPFPQGDRADDLQQASLLALRKALPADLFLVRDERVDDKGVDLSLELKHAGSFLNIRGQVQMKGTDRQELNADGTFSHSIDTSNLNYLLNGPSPLYVVWVAPRDELRFVWARDEAQRLHKVNSDWQTQGTVTLRFRNILSTQETQGIYERILSEGKLHRETHDILARATLSEPVVVAINPQSLSVTDPDKILNLLLNSGLSAITEGYATEVLRLISFLQSSQQSHPRILLVCAYARLRARTRQARASGICPAA